MPLTISPIGTPQYVKQISGREDVKRFLSSLGFVPGSQVTVISELSGNIIVNVKDTRIAIDKSMANRIIV